MLYESLADFKVQSELRLQVYDLARSMGTQEDGGKAEILDFAVPTAVAARYFIDKLEPER